ncbi:hypothetical protein VIGAN_06105300, partial [Vigna angularis var. angularis]
GQLVPNLGRPLSALEQSLNNIGRPLNDLGRPLNHLLSVIFISFKNRFVNCDFVMMVALLANVGKLLFQVILFQLLPYLVLQAEILHPFLKHPIEFP